ncbi:hypothetical protein EJ06DRAFT_543223 [Trichodelitschia bisporula]|uniref:Uncharacterized protein n=1 Tax=Trichodelitschia bisporula TaxID=703511 RepID=A0A6G1HXK1_9PEZI|nr:hypothetical protein EJ06DRAFT_543223 [Trichodelitschia bisporula]
MQRPNFEAPTPPGPSLDSWVEVSSQPSSSSLSSAAEEIITTGLRVQQGRRRRQRRSLHESRPAAPRVQSAGGSSQEEYEESESESDRVMTSSNEGIHQAPFRRGWQTASAPDISSASDNAMTSEDEDENATAIGLPRDEMRFTPQMHAFSQPRPAQVTRGNSNLAQRPRPATHRHSLPSHQHTPYNMISPSHHIDHDAALRASLSTLLSCAAAARGLPKSGRVAAETMTRPANADRIDPTTVRMVPESVALRASNGDSPTSRHSRGSSAGAGDIGKRKATAPANASPRNNSKERHAIKKARRTTATVPIALDDVNPTLLTWVVSAGVVVLFSAISFSAGYVMGKEQGRAEMEGAGRYGKHIVMESSDSLRRLKWAGTAPRVGA